MLGTQARSRACGSPEVSIDRRAIGVSITAACKQLHRIAGAVIAGLEAAWAFFGGVFRRAPMTTRGARVVPIQRAGSRSGRHTHIELNSSQ